MRTISPYKVGIRITQNPDINVIFCGYYYLGLIVQFGCCSYCIKVWSLFLHHLMIEVLRYCSEKQTVTYPQYGCSPLPSKPQFVYTLASFLHDVVASGHAPGFFYCRDADPGFWSLIGMGTPRACWLHWHASGQGRWSLYAVYVFRLHCLKMHQI